MGNNTNHGLFFEIGVTVALDFRALVRTPPDASNSEPLLLLMMEGRSRADIVTLRRRDVETSRRYCLLTFIMVDPTSRRWDVTTLGRRDVGTSRRCNHFHALLSTAPILLLKFALLTSFAPAFTELAILRYRAIKICI